MITVTVLVGGQAELVTAPSIEDAATVGEVVFPLDPEVFFGGARKVRRCRVEGCSEVIRIGARLMCERCYWTWRYPK